MRNAQKKLRLTIELQESVASGKVEKPDKAQKEKIKGIPKLHEELKERLEHAAEMEAALKAVLLRHAELDKAEAEAKRKEQEREEQASKVKEEERRQMMELAAKTAKVVIADKSESVELLTTERFAYVGPQWRGHVTRVS